MTSAPVRRLAGAQDDRHRLGRGGLVDMDRLEAAVVIGVEQCQLLAAVNPVLGVVDVEHDATGDLLEAVAEQLDHRRHHPLERGRAGQVLQPADGRLRAQIGAALGQPTDRHLESRVGTERITIVAVGIARRDQQGPIPDHLSKLVPHPVGVARVLDAVGQALGDREPLLDRRQQQYPSIRGHHAAIETQLHRLARDRWQTRQNPPTFVHGGRELRWPSVDPVWKPKHTRIQRFMSLPPAPSREPVNFSG